MIFTLWYIQIIIGFLQPTKLWTDLSHTGEEKLQTETKYSNENSFISSIKIHEI